MKKILYIGLVLGLSMALGVGAAVAGPFVAIDLDTGTAGIQGAHSVTSGDVFTIDVVVGNDMGGVSAFDTFNLDLFHDAGAVMAFTGGPIAGAMAGPPSSPFGTFDFFAAFAPVGPGGALATDGAVAPVGKTGIGGVSMLAPGGFFVGGAPPSVVAMSIEVTAGLAGIAAIDVGTLFGSSDILIAGGLGLGSAISGATLTVDPIPEPTTMLLFGSGLIGLAAWRRFKTNA